MTWPGSPACASEIQRHGIVRSNSADPRLSVLTTSSGSSNNSRDARFSWITSAPTRSRSSKRAHETPWSSPWRVCGVAMPMATSSTRGTRWQLFQCHSRPFATTLGESCIALQRDSDHRPACSSVPVVDLDVVRVRGSFPSFDQRLQTQEEYRPLGAAVVHELHRFFPPLVREEHDC